MRAVESSLGKSPGRDVNPADRGKALPWITGTLLILFYLLAKFHPGLWTWPFNGVAYLNPPWDAVFLVSCLAVLTLVSLFRSRLQGWNPSPAVQRGIILLLVAAFAGMIVAGSVYIPGLEGDGGIDHDYAIWRWRELLVRKVMAPALGTGDLQATLVAWRIVGMVYIIAAAFFIFRITTGFWVRFWSLALCASVPQVLSFTGHCDLYPITFSSLSFFLAALYLLAVRPSRGRLLLAIVSFYFALRAHPLSVTALIFPVAWWLVDRSRAWGRRWIVFTLPALAVAAGLILPARFLPERIFFEWGEWLPTVARYDGLVAALAHNFIIHLAYLLPTVYALVAVSFAGFRRLDRRSEVISASILLSLITLLLTIYAVELTVPLSGFGIREFLCLAGTFGGLFFVPTLLLLVRHLPGRIYCFAVFSLFLTLPALVVQRGPRSVERLLDPVADDRACHMMRSSPYLEIGIRLFHYPWWWQLPPAESVVFSRLACEILERGGGDGGFYRNFAPLNLYQAAIFRYGIGDRPEARRNLELLLRNWPRSGLLLLGRRWDTPTLDPDFPGVAKPHKSPLDHDYWQAQLIGEAEPILGFLSGQAGDPIYEVIRLQLKEPAEGRRLNYEEMKALVTLVSYFESPGRAQPYRDMQTEGIALLRELGMLYLLDERYPVPE